MRKEYLLLVLSVILSLNSQSQTVTDIDGNSYQTVQIGKQVWLKENLKTIRYNNGDSISNKWGYVLYGAYCNYNNNINNVAIYGRLYNGYAVKDFRNICPTGWHVPNLIEWQTLINNYGGENVAGGKMKEIGITHWQTPNTGSTNESGFTGLPAGQVFGSGLFSTLGQVGVFYSKTDATDTNNSWSIALYYMNANVLVGTYSKYNGESVRCTQDTINSINDKDNDDYLLYPNPAKDYVNIFCKYFQNTTLSISDLNGNIILQKRLLSSQVLINVGILSQGVYIIRISNKQVTINKKLIKE